MKVYRNGTAVAYHAYEQTEGKKFMEKEAGNLTADEELTLAKWATEHPDAAKDLEATKQGYFQKLVEAAGIDKE